MHKYIATLRPLTNESGVLLTSSERKREFVAGSVTERDPHAQVICFRVDVSTRRRVINRVNFTIVMRRCTVPYKFNM
jgi:hypothetical protein